jgi:hypothetical protein
MFMRGYIAVAGAMLAASIGLASAPAAPAPVQANVQEAKAVIPTVKEERKKRPSVAGGRTYRANGQREVQRRLRQIAQGQITKANGLAS